MYKLEPREAELIPCINPLLLPLPQREKLATLFDELCITAKKGNAEKTRHLIDIEIKKILT